MKIHNALLRMFEQDLIAEIETAMALYDVKAGDCLLETGQTIRVIPIIVDGLLKVSRIDPSGREIYLYTIHASESCAMTLTSSMCYQPSEVRAVAETDLQFMAVPVQHLDRWLKVYPGWRRFVMQTIRSRYDELLNAIDQLAFLRLDERLIHYLREKGRNNRSSLINLSHEQIASDLASSREVISRLLKRLETEGKLLLYRNQIKLLKEL